MIKLAIIDIDGVVANVDARFERAAIARSLYLSGTDRPEMMQKEATNLYWRTVFTPELVPLDTPIDGAAEALISIEHVYDEVLYLTSRPESLRQATVEWFREHRLFSTHASIYERLIMKPPAFQYTKTVVWKAGVIQMVARFLQADEVLVVDDEGLNLEEIRKHEPGYRFCTSLAEAVAPSGDEADHPF